MEETREEVERQRIGCKGGSGGEGGVKRLRQEVGFEGGGGGKGGRGRVMKEARERKNEGGWRVVKEAREGKNEGTREIRDGSKMRGKELG